MTLSNYHKQYSEQSDDRIQQKVEEKRQELLSIFKEAPLSVQNETVRLAVIGCGDKRFVKAHKKIFEEVLSRPVEVTTFDISIDHLEGEDRVIRHDCIQPLPEGPFDITYGHVVLKFVAIDKQLYLLRNSYDALNPGGIAIHVLNKEDYEGSDPDVPLLKWKEKLSDAEITHKEVPIKYGLALMLLK